MIFVVITVGRRYQEERGLDEENEWLDQGYVRPKVAECALLEEMNYDGLRYLDVIYAKLYLERELPQGYQIMKRIGKGNFGCCFLVEKKLQRVAPEQGNVRRTEDMNHADIAKEESRCLQMVLKVVVGNIKPRRPVRFYKSSGRYTLMISHKSIPLELVNLTFIIGILKYHHEAYQEVHGDLHPGNMMYFPKNVTQEMWRSNWSTQHWETWHHASHIVQATLDFSDCWFSMEDDQVTSIMEADMGGKIGEAKIIVNDLHHDPRNNTWQVSDDLTGLMNWVVRKLGYSIRSHPKRGIVYGITLNHLKILYKHITDVYERLDSKFIFTSVFASKDTFELKLEKGECYLDELLQGRFLKFENFKGPYSLGPSADETTCCVKMIIPNIVDVGLSSHLLTSCVEITTPTVVQAVPMSQKEVYEAFCKLTSSQEFLCTLKEALTVLVDPNLHGGVIFLIVDKLHKDKVQLQLLDEGALTQVCRQYAISLHHPTFKHILGSFCAHSDTDRWEEALLLHLSNNLKLDSQNDGPSLISLKNQPKDGAFVLSHKGTVLAAATRLAHTAPHLEMRKVDGTCVGTRHAASLGAAEWMRCEKILGTVFVKSDAGSVHVLIPDHNQELPRIALVHVD